MGLFSLKNRYRENQLAKPYESCPIPQTPGYVLLADIGYYLGRRIGFALTPRGQSNSTFWPPNAILLAALTSNQQGAGTRSNKHAGASSKVERRDRDDVEADGRNNY